MNLLSVIIVTQNEEKNIRDCLESIIWADEIIVVDGGSQDNTLEICKEYKCRVFKNPWPGYAEQKQYALDRAIHPWVLSIDSDERVTTALAKEIRDILASGSIEFDGFKIPRLSYFLGKKIFHSGWYPGYQLRLFKRDKTRLSDSRVHEGFLVDGKTGFLKSDLMHFTHGSVEESLTRMNRYSSLESLDRYEKRRTGVIHWYHFFVHPFSAFMRQYIVKKGFRDGIHGLILAMITSVVKFAMYVKIWELQHNEKNTKPQQADS